MCVQREIVEVFPPLDIHHSKFPSPPGEGSLFLPASQNQNQRKRSHHSHDDAADEEFVLKQFLQKG